MNDDVLAQGRSILASQPFSVLLGTRLDEFGGGRTVMSLALRPELAQQFGFAHGGVLSYLADNAVTFAAGSVLGPQVLTASLSIAYLRPAQGDLRAVATVTGSTRRQAVVRCDVFALRGADEVLVASAQGTVSTAEGVAQ